MSFRVEHRHSLSAEDAHARVAALGEYLINKHGIGVTWEGESARVNGRYLVVTIEGTVTFGPGVVVFDGKDPGFLWRGKAKDYLTAKLTRYLDPSVPAADLPRR